MCYITTLLKSSFPYIWVILKHMVTICKGINFYVLEGAAASCQIFWWDTVWVVLIGLKAVYHVFYLCLFCLFMNVGMHVAKYALFINGLQVTLKCTFQYSFLIFKKKFTICWRSPWKTKIAIIQFKNEDVPFLFWNVI